MQLHTLARFFFEGTPTDMKVLQRTTVHHDILRRYCKCADDCPSALELADQYIDSSGLQHIQVALNQGFQSPRSDAELETLARQERSGRSVHPEPARWRRPRR